MHCLTLSFFCLVFVVDSAFKATDSASYRTANAPSRREKIDSVRFHQRDRRDASPTTTKTIEDDHDYYTVNYYPSAPPKYPWIELSHRRDAHKASQLSNILSGSHRLAEIIELGFEFPYYGHVLQSVVVTTGGFLYMNPGFIYPSLANTQTIAPLMANFDFGLSDHSFLYYAKTSINGQKVFIVQWDNVTLQDHPDVEPFTFQCMLTEDGTIAFSYKEIPLKVSRISSVNHPVTVGISDAFFHDTLLPIGVIRSIYEYHRINLTDTSGYFIVPDAVIIFTPLPNCVSVKSCFACTIVGNFSCRWCNRLNRCSDGIDRYRQEWFDSGCDSQSAKLCTQPTTSAATSIAVPTTSIATSTAVSLPNSGSSGLSPGVYVGIVLAVLLVAIGVAWFVYAYTHPNSKSGLWLIEHGRFWKRSSSDKYSVNEAAATT